MDGDGGLHMTGIHQTLAGGRVLSTPSIIDVTTDVGRRDGYSIPMPSGVQAGRRLFAVVTTNAGFTAISAPNNPSGAYTIEYNAGTNQNLRVRLIYKLLTGSESGNITGDLPFSSIDYCGFACILDGMQDDGGNFGSLAEAATLASTVTPDTLTTPWGTSSSTLFISTLAWIGEPPPSLSAYPANYNLMQTSLTQSNIKLSVAARRTISASESPGAWTLSGSGNLLLTTISRYRGA